MIPQWSQLKNVLLSCKSQQDYGPSLSHVYTGDLRNSFGSHVNFSLFWRLVVRWVRVLRIPSVSNTGLTTKWDPIIGFSIHAAEQHTGDSRQIPRVWGEHSLIPAHKFRYAEMMDNHLSKKFLRGNDRTSILFGPLSMCMHACEFHANIAPDSDPGGSRVVDKVTGLSASDYRGAYAVAECFKGELLCYSHSQSSAAKDDQFQCFLCVGEAAAWGTELPPRSGFGHSPYSSPPSNARPSSSSSFVRGRHHTQEQGTQSEEGLLLPGLRMSRAPSLSQHVPLSLAALPGGHH